MYFPVLAAPLFGELPIRTIEREGELWFIGRDVAQALGYKNTSAAIARHLDADERAAVRICGVTKRDPTSADVTSQDKAADKGIAKRDTPTRARLTQEVTVISELGVYGLILGSELEAARPFKKWVRQLIQRYRTGDISLADEVLQRNSNPQDAEWLAARAAVKAGRAALTDVLYLWHTPENCLIQNVSKLVTRAVIGRTPAQYREAHGLAKAAPIRDHFTYAQLADVRWFESKLAALLTSQRPADHKAAYAACKGAVEVITGVIDA